MNAETYAENVTASVPPVPAPVRLTDPDDPRIQPGARLEQRIAYDLVAAPGKEGIAVGWVRARLEPGRSPKNEGLYLIAEAPDPDADKRQALVEIMTGIGVHDLTTDEADQVIMGLRERGVSL